jgi:hypothetical protein
MSEVLNKLQQLGQVLSKDLASHCGLTERTINEKLYPHVMAGRVMACAVYQDGKKVGMEYRSSGTIPRSRPGPKLK